MPIGNMLAAFGNRPSVLQAAEANRGVALNNRLSQYRLDSAIQAEQKQNRLGELYGRYASGDKAALDEMATVSPEWHMQIQKNLTEMDAAQREQLAAQLEESGRMALVADTPDKWGQLFPDVPFEQRGSLIARASAAKGVFDAIQEQEKQAYAQQKDSQAFDLQRRGQDITLRGQDMTDARARESNSIDGMKVDTERFKDANTLRDEFNKGAGDFIKVRDAYRRIEASAANPSPAGDMSLVFNYMKVLDPGSTVREGEYANATNAAGWPVQIRNAYNKALTGEILSPAQRADFVSQAKGLYSTQEESYLKLQSEYERLATRRGIDPSDVVVDYRLDMKGGLNGNKPPEAAKVGDIVEANGKKYRITGLAADGDHDVEPVQ